MEFVGVNAQFSDSGEEEEEEEGEKKGRRRK